MEFYLIIKTVTGYAFTSFRDRLFLNNLPPVWK